MGALSEKTDADLMTRLANGQVDCLDELMRRHQDLAFSVAYRMMSDRESALDITQEVFIKVMRKADRFRGEAAVSTWIYRITMNLCYDALRKSKRRPTESLPDHADPPDSSTQDQFSSVEVRPSIEEALNKLPSEFRAAVILSDIEGLSIAEMEAALGAPSGTIKSRVFRGRRMLAELLGNLDAHSQRPTHDA